MIITSWDDGSIHDLKLIDLLKKHHLPAIFFIPCNLKNPENLSRVSKLLSIENCLEIAKEFEIGSHTVNHKFLTRIPLEEAKNEIFDSKKIWEDRLGKQIHTFCYPRGYANEEIKRLVKGAGYSWARNTEVGCFKSENPYWTSTTVHVGIPRKEYDNWLIYARQKLLEYKPDDIFHIFGHSWEIELNQAWGLLDEFFGEINEFLSRTT